MRRRDAEWHPRAAGSQPLKPFIAPPPSEPYADWIEVEAKETAMRQADANKSRRVAIDLSGDQSDQKGREVAPFNDAVIGLLIMIAIISFCVYLIILPTLISESAIHSLQGAVQNIIYSSDPLLGS
jgi:hypothetical protein